MQAHPAVRGRRQHARPVLVEGQLERQPDQQRAGPRPQVAKPRHRRPEQLIGRVQQLRRRHRRRPRAGAGTSRGAAHCRNAFVEPLRVLHESSEVTLHRIVDSPLSVPERPHAGLTAQLAHPLHYLTGP